MKWTRYLDIDKDSEIIGYYIDMASGIIAVKFEYDMIYWFSKEKLGNTYYNTMCNLAAKGDGLNDYINRNALIKIGCYKTERVR
jgi:hypothetical protein